MLPSVPTLFSPWSALAGGVLIGLSSVLVMYFFGRIAGISGITVSVFNRGQADWLWRVWFIVGLILAPVIVSLISGKMITQTVSTNIAGMMIAGLLVGVGTVLGSGCTSGHGVCGLARLSARSFVAVGAFLCTAMLTVFFLRHVLAPAVS